VAIVGEVLLVRSLQEITNITKIYDTVRICKKTIMPKSHKYPDALKHYACHHPLTKTSALTATPK